LQEDFFEPGSVPLLSFACVAPCISLNYIQQFGYKQLEAVQALVHLQENNHNFYFPLTLIKVGKIVCTSYFERVTKEGNNELKH
jgi:hypothetical protein